MKKFIKKVSLYCLTIILVISVVNVWYKRNASIIDDDYTEKFKHVPKYVQICNFGSSHGKWDYNYEDIEKEYFCFNFGLGSQSLSYDYALMSYYGDRIEKGTVVLINISYFSLFGENEELRDDFQSKNKRYYKILPNTLIKNYDYKTSIYVKWLPCLASDNLLRVLFNTPVNKTDSLWDRVTTVEEVEENCYRRYLEHVAVNVDEEGNHIVNEAEVQALEDMIKFLQEKNAIPILVTPPYTDLYKETIKQNDDSFYDEFLGLIEEIEEKYGVDYYDYSDDERFCFNYTLFMDQDHMNRRGARLYTNMLFEEVIKGKLLSKR